MPILYFLALQFENHVSHPRLKPSRTWHLGWECLACKQVLLRYGMHHPLAQQYCDMCSVHPKVCNHVIITCLFAQIAEGCCVPYTSLIFFSYGFAEVVWFHKQFLGRAKEEVDCGIYCMALLWHSRYDWIFNQLLLLFSKFCQCHD